MFRGADTSMNAMDEPAADWFCATFESMPSLVLINEYRKLVGPEIPMFLVHVGTGSACQATLYLPPSAGRVVQKINRSAKLLQLTQCEKPSAAGIQLLFGDDSELANYFPESVQ